VSGHRGAAVQRVLSALRAHGRQVRQEGAGWKAQCPVHDDHDPSLGVTQDTKGARLRCWSRQCPLDEVLAALGLTRADLLDAPGQQRGSGEWTPWGTPPVARYPYVDEDGQLLFEVLRGPNKEFGQRRPDPSTRFGWRWKLDGVRRVPYRLPAVIQAVAEHRTVWLAEGEKDVHALEAAGVVASCNPGGAGKWKVDYDQYFAAADVKVIADKDEPGRKHALYVAEGLRRAGATVQILEALEGKDAADHLAAGHGLDRLTPVQTEPAERDRDESATTETASGGRGPSAATILVDIAEELYEFGVSETGDAYGVPRSGPRVVLLLRGGRASLRAQLAAEYRRRYRKVAAQQALADAMLVIEGIAQDATRVQLHSRVARHDEAIWVDIGDATGRSIRITADGWSAEDEVPVLFRQTALTAPLPEPVRGGKLDKLWEYLNVAADDRPLVAAYLVAAYWPEIFHPALGIFGEHGTAKTTAAKVLVLLVDPSPVPVRKPPKDAEQWVTAASGSWVVALDNLSAIPDWLSDSICRAVTGDGDVRRKLYSDGDLAVFAFLRVVILNGIDVGPLNGDLIDRMLPIHLDIIAEDKRLEETLLWQQFGQARPRILGALLDLAVKVLRDAPGIQLAKKPRMAGFARILAAVDKTLQTKGLARYQEKQRALAAESLTADPFVAAIRNTLDGERFEGTSGALLSKVTPVDEKWRPPRGWPASARAVTGLLRRQSPGMRRTGWLIEERPPGHDNAIRWDITAPPMPQDGDGDEEDSQRSQGSQQAFDQQEHAESGASESASDAREHTGDNSQADGAASLNSQLREESESHNSRRLRPVSAGQNADASDASLASDERGHLTSDIKADDDSFWATLADDEEWTA
jgi:hypothetical protein